MAPGLAAALAMLLTGCGGAAEIACTQIAALPGIAVTVDPTAAATLTGLTLRVCVGTDCAAHRVQLVPGSDSVDQGCEGPSPDSPCSATARPNGTQVGFVDIPDLPAGPLTVSARVTRRGGATSLPPVQIVAEPSYPNGRQCPASANQAAVTVGASALR